MRRYWIIPQEDILYSLKCFYRIESRKGRFLYACALIQATERLSAKTAENAQIYAGNNRMLTFEDRNEQANHGF